MIKRIHIVHKTILLLTLTVLLIRADAILLDSVTLNDEDNCILYLPAGTMNCGRCKPGFGLKRACADETCLYSCIPCPDNFPVENCKLGCAFAWVNWGNPIGTKDEDMKWVETPVCQTSDAFNYLSGAVWYYYLAPEKVRAVVQFDGGLYQSTSKCFGNCLDCLASDNCLTCPTGFILDVISKNEAYCRSSSSRLRNAFIALIWFVILFVLFKILVNPYA